jgi:hypothetical protein
MKNLSVFLFVISFGLVLSCHKLPKEPAFEEKFTAIKNGKPWSGKSAAIFNNSRSRFDILCDSTNEYGVGLEEILLRNIPFSQGTYRLRNPTGQQDFSRIISSFSTHVNDSYTGEFKIMESDSLQNFITILSVDSVSKEIIGTFNATFILWFKSEDVPNNPDTIRFKNGVFNTKLIF